MIHSSEDEQDKDTASSPVKKKKKSRYVSAKLISIEKVSGDKIM